MSDEDDLIFDPDAGEFVTETESSVQRLAALREKLKASINKPGLGERAAAIQREIDRLEAAGNE